MFGDFRIPLSPRPYFQILYYMSDDDKISGSVVYSFTLFHQQYKYSRII